MRLLFDQYMENGKRQVVILGGDIHVGTVAKITDSLSGQSIHQFTSSPITNKPARFIDWFLKRWSSRFTFHLDEGHNRSVHGRISERYRQRNFGMIKVEMGSSSQSTLKMYQEYEGEPDEIIV